MEKEFVPYDIALAMKELGYVDYSLAAYYVFKDETIVFDSDDDRHQILTDNPDECLEEVQAPLYQQAFRWFREECDLYGSVGYEDDLKSKWGSSVKGYYETWGKYDLGFTGWFKTYQEAQDACLRKLIEIVEENL
jgi:hypothetical protein